MGACPVAGSGYKAATVIVVTVRCDEYELVGVGVRAPGKTTVSPCHSSSSDLLLPR